METIAIQSTRRKAGNKGVARRLRAEGRVPAVVYGHAIDAPIPVSLDPLELDKALANPKGHNAIFALDIDGDDTFNVLVREVQRHPVRREIMHLDLVSPDMEREIVAMVPITVTGKAAGVQAGGKLRVPYREMRLRARPADFPASVAVDVTSLEQGDTRMASEVPLPEGVTALYDRDFVVAKVVKPRGRKPLPGEGVEAPAAEGEAPAEAPPAEA